MILDQQLIFSDSQAITVSTNSSNVIDNEIAGTVSQLFGAGDRLPFAALVTGAFAGGTSLQISLVSADDAGLTLGVVKHLNSPVIPVASLTRGALVFAGSLPTAVKTRRYLGIQYSVAGVMTAGNILAAFVEDLQTVGGTTAYPKGFSAA